MAKAKKITKKKSKSPVKKREKFCNYIIVETHDGEMDLIYFPLKKDYIKFALDFMNGEIKDLKSIRLDAMKIKAGV